MKAVVTGSSGLLGQAVARLLVEAGHDVTGLDLRDQPSSPFRQVRADLSSPAPGSLSSTAPTSWCTPRPRSASRAPPPTSPG